METLIDLNCEDVMVDLVFKHLLNGHHLMITYGHNISDPYPYRDAAVAFLGLSPRCCSRPMEKVRQVWIVINMEKDINLENFLGHCDLQLHH